MKKIDREDYNRVIKIVTFNLDDHNWDHFDDFLDFDMVNQYLCAVKEYAIK